MSDQMKVAIMRGAYDALGTGAAAFLASYALTNNLRNSLIQGGIMALTSLGFRGGVEGAVDTNKALQQLQQQVATLDHLPPPPEVRQ
jgi:hypothetical protein